MPMNTIFTMKNVLRVKVRHSTCGMSKDATFSIRTGTLFRTLAVDLQDTFGIWYFLFGI